MTADVRLSPRFSFDTMLFALAMSVILYAFPCSSFGIEPRQYAIEVSAEVSSSPFALRLSWTPAPFERTYTIKRRGFGETDWGNPIASMPAGTSQFTDANVIEGVAYEYEIALETTQRGAGGWVNAYGYILAGAMVSWPENKGKVLVIVDDLAASLENEIGTFLRDLIGSGWNPIRRDLSRTASVPEVKSLIRSEYTADPANLKSVILLGHVPVPYSGYIAPDLHESHRGAWPADVFYADVDGTWTDSVVNINSGDYDANDNWIGDGKFDQSQIPSTVELEIGRVDFYDLPAFGNRTQTDLLRSYLQRNSQFRHRTFTAARRMLIRDNFGDLSGDAPAVDAWRHYRQFFGPGAVSEVGVGGFFGTLQNESYLWAYGCGGGGNTKADGVGTTTDFVTQAPRAVFMVLHGSYFGDWNTKDNFLRAAIGGAGYPLASIWSGLPHWFMHPMGLGRNIGFTARLTQNNVSNYKSHLNFAAQQVHISLIGDPTLENFPVIPPRDLSGAAPGNVELQWTASTDENIVGYHVYYSPNSAGPFERITTIPVNDAFYSHAAGVGTHYYMVRAIKLERTGSGTFYNLSQGIFTSVNKTTGGTLPQIGIAVQDSDASENGPNNGMVMITRSFADANPLRVDILLGGTAIGGQDFNAIGSFITIPPSATSATLTVAPISDNIVEGEETVTIRVLPSANYTVGNPPSVLLAIADGINRAPEISQIEDLSLEAGITSSNLLFEITDAESSASDLQVSALSSNVEVLPPSGIVLGGSATTRTLTLTPPQDSAGTANVTIIVTDGVNETSGSFEVTVVPANKRPTARSQEAETLENEPVSITLVGQDPEMQSLTFTIQVPPSNGSITGSLPNIVYRPRSNYFGTDVFSFTVHDGKLASSPAEVSIRILERNKAPVVFAAQTNLIEDTFISLGVSGFDPNGDLLEYEIMVLPSHGSLTEITNGFYTYHPSTNFNGVDTFTFRAFDGELYSLSAAVELSVVGANDVPRILNREYTVPEDSGVDLLLVASDPDGDTLAFNLKTMTTNGVLSGTLPHLTYRPYSNFFGLDRFTYSATDGVSTSAVAEVVVTVEPVNDVPLAHSFQVEAEEDLPISIQLLGTDIDGDPLAFQILTLPKDGVVSGNAPNLLFQPETNFAGTNVLEFTVSDGSASSGVATVTIIVAPRNDAPEIDQIPDLVCNKNSFVGPLSLNLFDSDTPLSALRFSANSSNRGLIPTNRVAIVSQTTNTHLTVWPVQNATGEAEITLYVSDGSSSAAMKFLLSVTNTPPEPQDDEITESVGTVVIPVSRLLGNDVDGDGEQLSLSAVFVSELGREVLLTNQTVIYFGGTNAVQDSFDYEVIDSSNARTLATVWLVLTEDPRITSMTVVDGNVRLRVIGKAHTEFRVLSSADGRNWEHRGTGISDEIGRGEYAESGGASAHHRFYRTEWP